MDVNAAKYKGLKAKLFNRKKNNYSLDQSLSESMGELLPAREQKQGLSLIHI